VAIIRAILTLLTPGGYKRLVAENLTLRQQLIVGSRKRQKSPPLNTMDRIIFGLTSFFIPVKRLQKVAILVKPATILKFHRALVKRKYQVLFGTKGQSKLGRKGFDRDLVNLVVGIKEKNPSYGCPRIAMLVTNITGISISEQTVRRILRKHLKYDPGDDPSWLSFIGNQVDSLWSIDLLRIVGIAEIKTVPEIPISNPYVERPIGSTRRECLAGGIPSNE
jgi:putative transposase